MQKQWGHVQKREHWETLPEWLGPQQIIYPALVNTTSALNLLSLELSFSTWQVTFKFAFFERALRGHYYSVPKLLSGLELVCEQRASHIVLYLPYSHTWKPGSIWAGLLRTPCWGVSLPVVFPRTPKQ